MYVYVCTRRVPTVLVLLLELSRAMEEEPFSSRAGDSGDHPDPFNYGFFVTLGQYASGVTPCAPCVEPCEVCADS